MRIRIAVCLRFPRQHSLVGGQSGTNMSPAFAGVLDEQQVDIPVLGKVRLSPGRDEMRRTKRSVEDRIV